MKVTLLVPTWNEFESMTQIMPLVDKNWVDQILVVDGGSTDGTIEWSREQGYDVLVQKKKGLRSAYFESLEHITGDVVITFSPDGNSLAEHIPALIAKMKEGYDMVIVSRYLPPAKSLDDSWVTGFGNWFFTTLTNVLHGSKFTDAFVMFRAYKVSLLKDLFILHDEDYRTPERLFKTKIPIEPLLSVRAARARCRISEIPGDEPARIGGERKLQIIRWGAGFFYQIVRELFPRTRKEENLSLKLYPPTNKIEQKNAPNVPSSSAQMSADSSPSKAKTQSTNAMKMHSSNVEAFIES